MTLGTAAMWMGVTAGGCHSSLWYLGAMVRMFIGDQETQESSLQQVLG